MPVLCAHRTSRPAIAGVATRHDRAHREASRAVRDEHDRLQRPVGAVPELHAEAIARGVEHRGAGRDLDGDHAPQRGRGGARAGRRPADRDRRLPRHDRARLADGRLAGAVREGDGGRHPRAAHPDLARREVEHLHAGHRAAVRQLEPAQRGGPVRLLRAGGRLPRHRQRGRHQALRDERPLLTAAPRVRHPAAGRRRLDRRGRARDRRTSTPRAAGATTTSPTATPPS